jgi:hypothetical protein
MSGLENILFGVPITLPRLLPLNNRQARIHIPADSYSSIVGRIGRRESSADGATGSTRAQLTRGRKSDAREQPVPSEDDEQALSLASQIERDSVL